MSHTPEVAWPSLEVDAKRHQLVPDTAVAWWCDMVFHPLPPLIIEFVIESIVQNSTPDITACGDCYAIT